MKLSHLTKEQKQMVILGAIVGVITLVSAYSFVLQPLLRKWDRSRTAYEELTVELNDANKLLKSEMDMRQELVEKRESMRHIMSECIPDPENTLSWVTRHIYQYARKAGVDIRSVSAGSARTGPFSRDQDSKRTFSMYAVNIMVQCTYDDLMSFLREMETRNPYVCVSGLIISGQGNTPEAHNVSVELQWPVWKDFETAEKTRERIGGDHG